MNTILKISEAVTIAFHTMYYLAINTDRLVLAKEIAANLGISENHLAKILQRLSKEGFVDSVRGPKGGFKLAKEPDKIHLSQIYELIEGPLEFKNCLLEERACNGDACILSGLVEEVNEKFTSYLKGKTLLNIVNTVKLSKIKD